MVKINKRKKKAQESSYQGFIERQEFIFPQKAYLGFSVMQPQIGSRYFVDIVKKENNGEIFTDILYTSHVQKIEQFSSAVTIVTTKNSYYIVKLVEEEEEEDRKVIFAFSNKRPALGEKALCEQIRYEDDEVSIETMETEEVCQIFNLANAYVCKSLNSTYIICIQQE